MNTLAGVKLSYNSQVVASYIWLLAYLNGQQLSCMKYNLYHLQCPFLETSFSDNRQMEITYSESSLSYLISFIILSKTLLFCWRGFFLMCGKGITRRFI